MDEIIVAPQAPVEGKDQRFRLRDLKIGKFLLKKAPDILDVVDDYLPPVKILTELLKGKELSPEDQREITRLLQEYETEMYRIEVSDRQSARNREIEISKTDKFDLMFHAVGISCLSAFIFMLGTLTFRVIPPENREILIHILGIIEGAVMTLVAYYFGTSKSSSDKTKMLADKLK